jgi:CO/xanthine dehydrogenase Mo-binding subunit
VLHPDYATYKKKSKDITTPNVVDFETYGIGDIEAGFQQAELTYEHTFHTQAVHQSYIEPHACVVQVLHNGTIHVWNNTKAPYLQRSELAEYCSVPIEKVEMHFGNIGGDFGGKGRIMDEPICYYLALHSHRPVRMTMTREEELTAGSPRHAAYMKIKSGVMRDGTLVARAVDVYYDGGAYSAANFKPILGGIRRALGTYRIPNTQINGYAVYTNTIPAGHCRAPGDPQVFFAVESHTDIIAYDLGIDPYQFRSQNLLKDGDISPSGLSWRDINAEEVLNTAVRNSNWGKPKPTPFTGYGLAITERNTGIGGSGAAVLLNADGSATVISGLTDPGTGSSTIMRQILAQELHIPVEKVSFAGGNTSMAPFDHGSGNSRVTHITGQAVIVAAQDVITQLKRFAAPQLEVPEDQVTYEDGIFAGPGKAGLTLVEVLAKVPGETTRSLIMGRGRYSAKGVDYTCFTAQVTEVEVDPETGKVAVKRVVSANDIGIALNPLAVLGQVEGSVAMAVGFAMSENLPMPSGRPVIKSLADYKMLTTLDVPIIDTHLVEGAMGSGPYGAKSIGEQPVSATAPAIANAIFDAIGVRIHDLPITQEKVLRAIKAKGGQQ